MADDERSLRVARLAKKAAGYGKFARAYATLASLNEPDILCRVFSGCDFGTERRSQQSDWDAESWDNLGTLLTRAADRVIRKAKLAEYWRDVYQIPGQYDIRQDRIDGAPFPLSQGGFRLAQNTICSDEVPPIPSIALTRRLQSTPTKATIRLGDKEHRTAILLLWREVRLALGPVRALDNIGPLLEFRSILEAEIGGQSVTFDNPFTDGSDLITQAIIDGHTIAVEVDEVDMLDMPSCAEPQIEHSWFGWLEVTPATLRDAFTESPHDVPRDFWGSISNRDEDTALRDRASSWFVSTHPAYFIETSLHSGSFERELLARCEYLKGLLSARKADAAAAARNAAAYTLARWQADDHAPGDQ